MTVSTLPYRLLVCLATIAIAAGCDKKPDGPSPAADGKKPKTTLKLADVKKTYSTEIDDPAKASEPVDKRVAAFVAKTGKPETDDGRKKVWYALEGDNCFKVEIDGKDGSMLDQSARKSECGF